MSRLWWRSSAEEAAMVDLVVCRGNDGDKDGVGVMGMVSDGVRLGDGGDEVMEVAVRLVSWRCGSGGGGDEVVAVVGWREGCDDVDCGGGWPESDRKDGRRQKSTDIKEMDKIKDKMDKTGHEKERV
ncbi:hypothetical protein Tco_1517382 [Tanacetum coccineum]